MKWLPVPIALWATTLLFVGPALGAVADAPAPAPAGEYRLWPGRAPGSENWTVPEVTTVSKAGDRMVTNVSVPTLTVFLPDPAIANGAAILIAPGGALRLLSIDNEGVSVARWLNARGIAAFVLKYRTLQVSGQSGAAALAAGPPVKRQAISIRNANANPEPDNAELAQVLRLATADAAAAMRLIRQRADELRVDPRRVGMMGFSAGGSVAVAVAMAEQSDATPSFLVSVYGPSVIDVHVRADSPPLFIAVGSEHFNVTAGCLALFSAWTAAGRPAELHVYDGIAAGFGMRPRGLPVDGWKDRLLEWLGGRRLLSP